MMRESVNPGYAEKAASCLSMVADNTYATLLSIIHVNYEVVSLILTTFKQCLSIATSVSHAVVYVCSHIFGAAFDFAYECGRFVLGLFYVLWKFLILIGNILDVIFKGIEQTFYFIIFGSKWTASVIDASIKTMTENFWNLYESITNVIEDVLQVSSNAIIILGTFTYNIIASVFGGVKYIVMSTCHVVDSTMIGIAEGVRYITDNTYYFLVSYLPNLSKEKYLGVLSLCIIYILLSNTYRMLSNRGMTFPFLSRIRQTGYDRRTWMGMNGTHFEFSDDDDVADSDDEFDESEDSVDENSVLDDEDEFEDEELEFEVTDDSDVDSSDSHESDATSTATYSEIDIQLPSTNNGRYNLRRSNTPCRSKLQNADDFEREIEREREKQKCVVCQDNNKSVLILPCRHMCLCVECGNHIARARNVSRRVCPLCRHKIRTIMNVYV